MHQSDDPNDDAACAAASVTRLLNAADAGDGSAAGDLLPLVYAQLHGMANRKMRHERADHTLQATALVHEAYLRLVDRTRLQRWESRWQFFAAAAEAMRRILVERARARGRIKRGGHAQRVDLASLELSVHEPPDELIALDEALRELAREHPDRARLVNLRYFGGLTHEQAAAALGVSVSTADRHWAYARAWLYRRMATPTGENPERP